MQTFGTLVAQGAVWLTWLAGVCVMVLGVLLAARTILRVFAIGWRETRQPHEQREQHHESPSTADSFGAPVVPNGPKRGGKYVDEAES